MKNYLKLIRVKHYIKNIMIFLPLIFDKRLLTSDFIRVLFGFLSFSFMASVVYVMNDIKDVNTDRLHEIKKHRPIASGKISIKNAIICAVILVCLSFVFCYLSSGFNVLVYMLLLIYLAINILYSFKIKNIVIIDILFLVIGFVLRVYYGASIIDIKVSNWMYLTIMSILMIMGLQIMK